MQTKTSTQAGERTLRKYNITIRQPSPSLSVDTQETEAGSYADAKEVAIKLFLKIRRTVCVYSAGKYFTHYWFRINDAGEFEDRNCVPTISGRINL